MSPEMWQLQASTYGSDREAALEAASLSVCAPQPCTRQKAVEVFIALAKACDIKDAAGSTGTSAGAALAADVDLIFQYLCVVAATDDMRRLRLAALKGLAGLHHASTAIKLQALSKKATLRIQLPSSAQHETMQQASSRKRKQQQQEEQPVDAGLLDAATGALVHGTEDDIPQVRLAAVEAVTSLASHDVLFADAAGLLLSYLINDQLQDVRLAALHSLLQQARVFWQHKQQHESQLSLLSDCQPQQQQQQQQQQQEADVHSHSQPQGSQQQQQHHQNLVSTCQGLQGVSDMDTEAADQLPETAADRTLASPHQQPRPRQKPRKSDLPQWGRDAMLAAAAALSDEAAEVRLRALQLLCLLPPGNVPDLVSVLKGLMRCIQRSSDCEKTFIWQVVHFLAIHRAEMVTLAAGKLVPLLADVLQQPTEQQTAVVAVAAAAPSAAVAAVSSPVDAGVCTAPVAQTSSALQAPVGLPVMAAAADVQLDAGVGVTAAAAAAAAAAENLQGGCVNVAVGGNECTLPLAASLLTQLLLAGVQQRHQGVPALLKWVEKAGLDDVPSLQLWLTSVRGVQQAPSHKCDVILSQ